MRGPCPYCRLPRITAWWVDGYINQVVRDIKEHPCYGWAPKPPLPLGFTDTSFIREAWNTAEGLERWRAQL